MKELTPNPHLASFESFRVDLRTEEISKNGVRIRLPGQSFQILALLLERRGELVTRQEIQSRLWPNDTVVEFENSINAAMKRLRAALGDSAEQPRCIETLARRGYRWVAAVEWSEASSPAAGTSLAAADADAGRGFARRHARLLVVSAAVLIIATVCGGAYLFSHRAPALISKDSIILAEFKNSTGDAVFDGTLRQGLAAELEQSPYLDILSDEQIVESLRLMSQPGGTHVTHEVAREVCRRTGGAVMLDGSIAQIGNQYQVILTAFECATGARVGSVQAVASDRNHVLGALGSAGATMRAKLGESLASIAKFNAPLEEVTTPSLEALQAYTLGWQAELRGDETAAADSFASAIALDPEFAMAYATLGRAYGGRGESGLAAVNIQKAYGLRERVSAHEKFYISAQYEMNVTRDLEKANQILRLWTESYPRDVIPVGELGWDDTALGRYDESLSAAGRARQLAPALEMPYELQAYSYLELDRWEEARNILEQAKARGIDSAPLHELGYAIAFLAGDRAAMARELEWTAGKPGTEDVLIDFESDSMSYEGHLVAAKELTERAVASARRAGANERAEGYLAAAALREALVSDAGEARRGAAVVQASSDREAHVAVALALALTGNIAQAQKLAANLAQRSPQDTVVQFNYLPTLLAAVALGQRSPAKAIARLQAAVPYDFGTPSYLSLCSVYLRGEAFLAAHRGSEAAGEFQKILDHRGVSLNGPGPIRALAQLQLGRAYALQVDTDKARAAYQGFFTLWKDADPDIPVLIAARAEYANLKTTDSH